MILFLAIIFCLIIWTLYQAFFGKPDLLVSVGGKAFTLEELKNYNGVINKELYVSVKNVVFDVTDSGMYAIISLFFH